MIMMSISARQTLRRLLIIVFTVVVYSSTNNTDSSDGGVSSFLVIPSLSIPRTCTAIILRRRQRHPAGYILHTTAQHVVFVRRGRSPTRTTIRSIPRRQNHPCSSTRTLLSSNNDDDASSTNDNGITKNNKSKDHNDSNNNNDVNVNVNVTGIEIIQVIVYRLSLIVVSLAFGVHQFTTLDTSGSSSGSTTNFLEGTGLSRDGITTMNSVSGTIFLYGILFTAVSIPKYRGTTEIVDSGRSSEEKETIEALMKMKKNFKNKNKEDTNYVARLNDSLPILSILILLIKVLLSIAIVINGSSNITTTDTVLGLQRAIDEILIPSVVLTMLAIREIGYYGLEYKVEALIIILLIEPLSKICIESLPPMIEHITNPLLMITLLLLAFGKVFEPVQDDIQPNNSNFFQD